MQVRIGARQCFWNSIIIAYMELKEVTKELIAKADYLSLSTTDGTNPWATPLYFAVDEKFNFYFVSRKDTLHSKNLYKNPNVSFCIFNSEDKAFTAQGLQATGIAHEVGLAEALQGLTVIYKKKHPDVDDLKRIKLNVKSVTGLINNRIYCIKLTHVYVLDPNNPDMDTRVEVFVNSEK